VPIAAGTHISLFMCPTHNDVPSFVNDGVRPGEFWDKDVGLFAAYADAPGIALVPGDEDSYLAPAELLLTPGTEAVERDDEGIESGKPIFKLGGIPARYNEQHKVTCGCGAPMAYLLQLPESYEFPKQANAPEQPDSFSRNDYCLFLGNVVTLLVCTASCDPRAVTVTLDN